MAILNVTSPHLHKPVNTGAVMRQVIYATVPGVAIMLYFFGSAVLVNLVLAVLTALASEAAVLRLRHKPVSFYLNDYSAVVTAVLLALAIPPTAPWWLTVIGTSFSVVVAKQLYGGLGMNPFNPAMVGYVLLLISFPKEMTSWLPAAGVSETAKALTPLQSLQLVFTGQISGIDSFTGATPLDTFKTYAGQPEILDSNPVLSGRMGGFGWEWVNMAFLLGGLYLIWRKIITWHIPVAMLGAMLVLAGIFHGAVDADNYAGALFHLFSGGTMLGAFFIATDPVSAATSNKGKIVYGIGIGALVYVIRTWGGYPDAIAFSVLLMNLAAPTIDYYTQPRTYGHNKPNKGLAKQVDAMQMIRQSVSRNSIILGIFAIATTGMIVLTANLTRDSIAKAVEDTLKKSLFEVMPRDRLDNDLLNDQLSLPADKLLGTKSAKAAYVAKQHGDPTGVILQAVAPEGYGGSINLLVGIDSQGAITGVRVIPPHFETPGLGDAVEVQEIPWILSFNGKSLANTPESRWRVKKDGGEFDAFTGATITPRAVVDAVYKALQYFDANKASLLHADTAAVTSTQEAATDVGH